MPAMVQRVAAKAVIVNKKGQILILREATTNPDRSGAGGYQFPGGRIEPGESFFEALTREVYEETSLRVQPELPLSVGEWMPVIRGQQQHIVALFMGCQALTEEVTLSEEHDEFAWITLDGYGQYDFMKGEPTVEEIAGWLERR